MQIIGCQLDIVWENKPANFERVRSLLAGANVEKGALVVLPEMFATGFSMNVAATAEPADGPTCRFLAELAREHACHVLGGVATRPAEGPCRNEAVIFDPQGREQARYCKLQPFTLGGEGLQYAPGAEVATLTCGEFMLAPFVCYDLRFPEIFRRAMRRGANLLAVIANWPMIRDAHWLALLKARAIENQAYVVGVNRVGRDPLLEYVGHSLIVDPRGETIAAAGEAEQLLLAKVDLAPLEEYRRKFPFLKDTRGEFLGEVT